MNETTDDNSAWLRRADYELDLIARLRARGEEEAADRLELLRDELQTLRNMLLERNRG